MDDNTRKCRGRSKARPAFLAAPAPQCSKPAVHNKQAVDTRGHLALLAGHRRGVKHEVLKRGLVLGHAVQGQQPAG